MSTTHVLSPQEQTFLAAFAERHPAVGENFARYLAANSSLRPGMAIRDLQNTLRAGWVKRGIPTPESVWLHVQYVEKYAFNDAPSTVDHGKSRNMASVHDMPEAIITDFTPHDPVTTDEKALLEEMAIKVIYEASCVLDQRLGLIREYAAQKTAESHWLNDVDKLDPVFVALHYEALYPEKRGLFEEFATSAKPRLKTDHGLELFEDVVDNQDHYREEYRVRSNGLWLPRGEWAGR